MPPIVNRYTRLVGINHPIVQEGLGPFRTPKLAAADLSAEQEAVFERFKGQMPCSRSAKTA